MKKIIFLILFISTVAIAQNQYVDPDGSNTSPFDTWAKACTTFANIDWGSLGGGDTLFVSGGSDSTVYNETLTVGASGGWDNYLYILPGKYSPSPSGHDGKVIIDGDSTRSRGIYINGESVYKQWIYVKGFAVTNHLCGSAGNGGIVMRYATGHIVIDSNLVYLNAGFYIAVIPNSVGQWTDISAYDSSNLATDITIKNNRIWTYVNNSNAEINSNCDDLVQVKGTDGLRFYNNFCWNRNTQADVPAGEHAHQDGLQVYTSKDAWVYNNIFIHDSSALGHPLLFGAQTTNNQDTSIIYNNFLYAGGVLNSPYSYMALYLQEGYVSYDPLFVFHNTIVGSNGRTDCIMQTRPLTYAKNNILIHLGSNKVNPTVYGGNNQEVWRAGSRLNYADSVTNNLIWSWFDGNLMTGSGWRGSGGTPTGAPDDWADWIDNYGGTGVNDNPDFVEGYYDIGSEFGYKLGSTSPAINVAGTDVQAFIESKGLPWTDIEGNSRDGTPDIGAYEYGGTADTTASISFTSVNDAVLNSYHIAYGIVSGIDSVSHVWTATSDSFAVSYPFSLNLTMQEIENGDTIAISNVASGTNGTTTTNTIIVSGINRSFSVTTIALPDTVPASFAFIDYGYANTSQVHTHFPFVLSSFDSCSAYFDGEDFDIYRDGSWQGYSSTIRKIYGTDDSLRLKLTSSGSYDTEVNAEFDAGGVTDTWSVTTKGDGEGVDSLGIENVEGVTQEETHPPLKTNDGLLYNDDVDSRWAAQPMPEDLVFDLGETKTVVKFDHSFAYWFNDRVYYYSMDVSNDYTNWYEIISLDTCEIGEWRYDSLDVGYNVRYVRLNFIGNNESPWADYLKKKYTGR